MAKQEALVTRDSLTEMLKSNNPKYVEAVVGKAMLALYNRQTEEEQSTEHTKVSNGIGFSAFDAELGTKVAKAWKANKHLDPWMVFPWLKKNKNGVPRLARYHRQLNEIALEKCNGY